MKKLASTLNMPYEQWLSIRKTGIGGSDAGAICGLNPYTSSMSVYHDKTTEAAEIKDNEAMRQGRDLGEYVVQRFMEASGLRVRRSHVIYQHDDYPFLLANVNRLVVVKDAGLECKTASPYLSNYYPQAKNEMAIPLNGFDEKLERRQEIAQLIKKLEVENHQIDQEIKIFMGESVNAYTEHYRVSWNTVNSVRINSGRLKTELPELYQKYVKNTLSRRFAIKIA